LNINIRSCGLADADALALVSQATFLETYAGIVSGKDMTTYCADANGAAHYRAWLAQPEVRIWLAEAPAGAPVGFTVLMPNDLPLEPQPGDIQLKRIYLLRRFHGTGLGSRLLQVAIDQATAFRGRRLLLSVFRQNERALGFYARHRFTQVGTNRFRVGDTDYDDLVLSRHLEGALP
jgi:GNAT superfamily N-acetyltransferase